MTDTNHVLELIHVATKYRGVTVEELEADRAEIAAKRGCFEERIYLVEIEIDQNAIIYTELAG